MTTTTIDRFAQLAGDYAVDPTGTRIEFLARQFLVGKVHGSFARVEGVVHIDDDLTASRAALTIEVNSIDTGNARRDKHLRTAFFDHDSHPRIAFETTGVRRRGGTGVEAVGRLTIKGVTQQVVVPMEYDETAGASVDGQRVRFTGSAVVNRKDFDVAWNALDRGGLFIGDRVALALEISAIKVTRPAR